MARSCTAGRQQDERIGDRLPERDGGVVHQRRANLQWRTLPQLCFGIAGAMLKRLMPGIAQKCQGFLLAVTGYDPM